jgi:hypothetical protein
MGAISIGIQVIMPKTGTSQQPTPPQHQPANDNADASVTAAQAPPPPGMGRLVDKTV